MLHARAAQLREILVKTQNMYLVPSSWKHPLTKAPRLIGATDAVLLICLAIFFVFGTLSLEKSSIHLQLYTATVGFASRSEFSGINVAGKSRVSCLS